MKFERITDTEYVCRSDSGAVYDLTAEPIPDEFESAMRCGISPADEFVQQIPRVWSCDCPAARRGLEAQSVQGLSSPRSAIVPKAASPMLVELGRRSASLERIPLLTVGQGHPRVARHG